MRSLNRELTLIQIGPEEKSVEDPAKKLIADITHTIFRQLGCIQFNPFQISNSPIHALT